MWFDSWFDILRILAIGSASYVTLVVVLRVSGKRTLGQLNAFDFIVTVALGSTLAAILVNPNVSWAEGFAALALLAGLQFVVASVSARWQGVRAIVTSEPVMLVRDGTLQHAEMRKNRLGESEILQAVRSSGCGDMAQVAAVVLETNGKISVITSDRYGDGSAMTGVVNDD
jgi:uncharacterized membrane protein YcaP (DUF421 family)